MQCCNIFKCSLINLQVNKFPLWQPNMPNLEQYVNFSEDFMLIAQALMKASISQ